MLTRNAAERRIEWLNLGWEFGDTATAALNQQENKKRNLSVIGL